MHHSYRFLLWPLALILVLTCAEFLSPTLSHAQNSPMLAADFISAAHKLKLETDPQWYALLHYAPRTFSVTVPTRIKSPKFFLSPHGSYDPGAELDATIEAFFDQKVVGDEHPRCRYPARFAWLDDKLQIGHRGKLSDVRCERFSTWIKALAPEAITLIFPASFLNNPASAFGHTFLRLDQKSQNEETRLLSYAADFAAQTSGESALVYASKGVFGGFDGFYSVAPFHKKVEKYSDLENRDIWEYHLALTEQEVALLTAHLWELRDVPLTYFYFDENCSYHILALLDVARPALRFSVKFPVWAMPVDTVRAVLASNDLVRSEVFRPSAATKLREKIAHASSRVADSAIRIARQPNSIESMEQLSSNERAEALDIAFEYNTYQRIRKRSVETAEQEKAFQILKLRSKITAAPKAVGTVPPFRPDQGHQTSMASIGLGRLEDKNVAQFQFRPALHALSDRPQGYLPGNQIKFFDTVLRLSEEEGVDIQRFTALDIMALTPRDQFFDPISWRINLSGLRYRSHDGRYPFVYSLNGGAGVTYQLTESLIGYGMIDGDLMLGDDLNYGHAIGAGPELGSIYLANQWFGLEAKVSRTHYFAGENYQSQLIGVSPRVSLGRDLSVRIDARYQTIFERTSWDYMLRVEHFFAP